MNFRFRARAPRERSAVPPRCILLSFSLVLSQSLARSEQGYLLMKIQIA